MGIMYSGKEIKFRAWLPTCREMIYGVMVGGGNIALIGISHKGKDITGHALMQFTNLYDNQKTAEYPNGKPIYEGDIVFQGELVGEVVWFNGSWVVAYNPPDFCMYLPSGAWEVIGNKFENPSCEEEKRASIIPKHDWSGIRPGGRVIINWNPNDLRNKHNG